ncbi:enolase C-terminal domain-like protein [Mycobacterium sp. AT1]|uniref:enolase C-terminal domain-like protein n=1 Tax=Mycobacterium sp. AT1 TaxID=1961706 RepID=UPI0009AD1483|nr:enolase C-terminal domain-like protein [Mycobacterium sp. AT1]OPX12925.1 hypothetical protein B1790_01685 [Mycobacterium sp. AT1]
MHLDEGILDLRVTRTRVDQLRFDIDPPLHLAGRSIGSREYVVLEVTLETGATGTAYVLTRGQPIGAAASALAHQVLDSTLGQLFSPRGQLLGRSPDQRARAVLDNCAWDLAGLVQGVPTWRLLGASRTSQPVLLVAGYRRHGESDGLMARRLAGWREKGYRSVKIAADLRSDATTRLLAAIREIATADELELVVDLGFAGRDVSQVVDAARAWEPYGIAWVEDPLPVGAATDIAEMRAAAALPIAAGDEASQGELFGLLDADAVDVLRADSTTVGGLTGLSDVVTRATVPVALHVYPEIHRHAALVMNGVSPIETFPPDDPFDFVDRFVQCEDSALVDGGFLPPTTPGLGLRYRPESLSDNVVESTTFAAD